MMSTLPTQLGPTRRTPFTVLSAVASDIKLAHSVFALPFAILGAFLAKPMSPGGWDRFAGQLALVVVCMVAARTWAMLVNRLADRSIDVRNPRTARRALPAGRLRVTDAALVAAGCASLFILTTAAFAFFFHNPWPLYLSVPVLLWIAFYSFTKRFTALCHLFIGGALALSPLAAATAVRPEAVLDTPALWFLAGMVLFWVAGFDVIYALQDVDFDRSASIFSLPSKLGPRVAIWVSRVMHAGAWVLLVFAARAEPRMGRIFAAAVLCVGGLLVAEHVVLAKRGKAGLDMAFFTLNGVVSCVLGAAGVIDLLK